jgi:predicted DNA-binding protein with PD1-like motif
MLTSRVQSEIDLHSQQYHLKIDEGESIYDSLRARFERQKIQFCSLVFLPANLQSAFYHTASPDTSGKTIVRYGEAITIENGLLLSANAVFGQNQGGQALIHCHGCLVDSYARMHGGHLDLQRTIAGVGGVQALVIATKFTGFKSKLDKTSNLFVFQPVRLTEEV